MKIKKIYIWKNVSVTYERMTNVNNGCDFQMKENEFFTYVREWYFSNVSDWLGYKCKYEWVFHMWGIWIRMGETSKHAWVREDSWCMRANVRTSERLQM